MLKIDSRVYSDEYDCKGTIIAFDKMNQAVVQFDGGEPIQLCVREDLRELPNLEEEFIEQVNDLLREAADKIGDARTLAQTKKLLLNSKESGEYGDLIFSGADDLLTAFDNAGWNTSTMTAEC